MTPEEKAAAVTAATLSQSKDEVAAKAEAEDEAKAKALEDAK